MSLVSFPFRSKAAPSKIVRNTGLYSGGGEDRTKRKNECQSFSCTYGGLECWSCFLLHKDYHKNDLNMQCCLCLWYHRFSGTGEVRKRTKSWSFLALQPPCTQKMSQSIVSWLCGAGKILSGLMATSILLSGATMAKRGYLWLILATLSNLSMQSMGLFHRQYLHHHLLACRLEFRLNLQFNNSNLVELKHNLPDLNLQLR